MSRSHKWVFTRLLLTLGGAFAIALIVYKCEQGIWIDRLELLVVYGLLISGAGVCGWQASTGRKQLQIQTALTYGSLLFCAAMFAIILPHLPNPYFNPFAIDPDSVTAGEREIARSKIEGVRSLLADFHRDYGRLPASQVELIRWVPTSILELIEDGRLPVDDTAKSIDTYVRSANGSELDALLSTWGKYEYFPEGREFTGSACEGQSFPVILFAKGTIFTGERYASTLKRVVVMSKQQAAEWDAQAARRNVAPHAQ